MRPFTAKVTGPWQSYYDRLQSNYDNLLPEDFYKKEYKEEEEDEDCDTEEHEEEEDNE